MKDFSPRLFASLWQVHWEGDHISFPWVLPIWKNVNFNDGLTGLDARPKHPKDCVRSRLTLLVFQFPKDNVGPSWAWEDSSTSLVQDGDWVLVRSKLSHQGYLGPGLGAAQPGGPGYMGSFHPLTESPKVQKILGGQDVHGKMFSPAPGSEKLKW